MYAGLLAGSDADRLSVICVADRVRLCILQCDEGNDKIALSGIRNILVGCNDILEDLVVDLKFISSLFECDTEDLFVLKRLRHIALIDLDNVIVSVLLALQDLKRLLSIAGGDNAVGDFPLDDLCCGRITDIGEGNEIAEGAHSVSSAGTCVSTCERGELTHIIHKIDLLQYIAERKADCSACRGNMLEGCR